MPGFDFALQSGSGISTSAKAGRSNRLSEEELPGRDVMACRRCSGFMIVEFILPCLEETASSDSTRTRCLNCGNVEDSVICLNRMDRPAAHASRSVARVREGVRP